MKKLLLSVIIAFTFVSNTKASHILGGEITWECLSSGQYIFKMVVFRDCDGIPFGFNNQTLEIFNNPLPRNQNNQTVRSIQLRPDSNKWLNARNGDTAPTCDPNSPEDPYSCSNGDVGTVQQFFFSSAPITLRGVPPSVGWRFVWTAPCCRPNDVQNLAMGGTMILRAEMFPTRNNDNTDPCIDSSPQFRALPTNLICRGYEFTYNHTAIDKDLDSLVYSWDRTYNSPGANPTVVGMAPRYAPNNPTPDATFNPNNIPSTLDPLTGIIKTAVYSNIGSGPRSYLTVIQVDGYRDGRIISSVYREIPYYFFDCPPLASGQINGPPSIFIDGQPAEGLITDIVAGQTVRIPFQAQDQDFTGYGTGLQRVKVIPAGFMFSTRLTDKNLCEISGIAPCATLENRAPVLNQQEQPPQYEVSGLAGVATELVWDTRCYHIATVGTGVPGQAQGIYNFVMRVQDDHCPIPGINYPTITVRVRDPIPLTEPIMKGASVELDGRLIYSWVPPMDSTFTFERYESEFSSPNDGQPIAFWQALDPIINNYQQRRRNGGFQFFVPGANNEPNILVKRPNRDWYFRMLARSGCTDDVPSQFSEPVQVMEVNATPSGPGTALEPARSEVTLTWNRPKPLNASTYPYFEYESPTHFYIWQNDSIEQNGQYIGGEAVEGNWYLRGDTNALTYTLATNTCNGRPGFRIEARDTVVTWREGTAPRQDSLDTLTYRTFSIIDTMLMVSRGYIPQPRLDTLEIRPNGDVYFRIDRANAGTVGSFRVLTDPLAPLNPPYPNVTEVDSFNVEQDSLLMAGANGLNSNQQFIIESIDACQAGNRAWSEIYSNFRPQGRFDECGGFFRVGLDDPTGFRNGIAGYRIYVDTSSVNGSGPYALRTTINDPNQDSVDVFVTKNTEHWIKVVAFDQNNDVIISHAYFPSTDFRTDEIVPAPPIYCTFVEADGSVTLTFRPLGDNNAENQAAGTVDSTDNWLAYEIEYRRDGGAWQTFAGSNLIAKRDTFVNVNTIDAFNGFYEFRSRSRSGCDGTEYSPYSDVISAIQLTGVQLDSNSNPPVSLNDAQVELNWNANGASNLSRYRFHKGFDQSLPPFGSPQAAFIDATENTYLDNDPLNEGSGCDFPSINYHLTIEHVSGCVSRSTYQQIDIRGESIIPTQPVDVVTVNPQTGEVEIYWSVDAGLKHAVNILEEDVTAPVPGSFLVRAAEVPWSAQRAVIPTTVLDPSDTVYTLTAQTVDTCTNSTDDAFEQFDFHTTMDVDVEFVQCDSVNILTWNPYTDFRDTTEVSYEVYVGENLRGPFSLVPNSETTDTTYNHKITEGEKRYYYYIKATDGGNQFSSTSNVDSDTTFFQEEPLYRYLHYATVLPTKEVELSFYKDTSIEQGGYTVYRGLNQDDMQPLTRFDGAAEFKNSLINYVDPSAETDNYSYFYNVVIENTCGNAIDTSNVGRTIHLQVEADNEAITNTLRWNEYQRWDSAVAFYNIYRGFNGAAATELYATVPPTANGDPNSYIDDVYDNALVIGQYCYRVEAVQGPMTTSFPNNLSNAVSSSNEVCVTQKPLFYVPNAFAPDGVNRMFTPKGQFFDFSLYEMIIYNRWGEEIFVTRDINKGWTGEVNGEPAQQGSYVYTIRFVDADGEEHRRKGTVTLIR